MRARRASPLHPGFCWAGHVRPAEPNRVLPMTILDSIGHTGLEDRLLVAAVRDAVRDVDVLFSLPAK